MVVRALLLKVSREQGIEPTRMTHRQGSKAGGWGPRSAAEMDKFPTIKADYLEAGSGPVVMLVHSSVTCPLKSGPGLMLGLAVFEEAGDGKAASHSRGDYRQVA